LGYISVADSMVSLTTLYVMRPAATEFGEITQTSGLLRRSRSFEVTDFGTHRNRLAISD